MSAGGGGGGGGGVIVMSAGFVGSVIVMSTDGFVGPLIAMSVEGGPAGADRSLPPSPMGPPGGARSAVMVGGSASPSPPVPSSWK